MLLWKSLSGRGWITVKEMERSRVESDQEVQVSLFSKANHPAEFLCKPFWATIPLTHSFHHSRWILRHRCYIPVSFPQCSPGRRCGTGQWWPQNKRRIRRRCCWSQRQWIPKRETGWQWCYKSNLCKTLAKCLRKSIKKANSQARPAWESQFNSYR